MLQEDSSSFFKPLVHDIKTRPISPSEAAPHIEHAQHGKAAPHLKVSHDHGGQASAALPIIHPASRSRSEQSSATPANPWSTPIRKEPTVFSEISDCSAKISQITLSQIHASQAHAVTIDSMPTEVVPQKPARLLPAWLVGKDSTFPLGLILASAIACYVIARSSPTPGHAMVIMVALMASACVSSVVGFAFSAIAGASLYHFVGSPIEAVRIMLWCSIAIQVYSVIRLWKSIEWLRLVPFLLGGFATVGPFCWLVLHITPKYYLAGIGLFIAIYGTYLSFRKPLTVNPGPKASLALDLLTGAFGGITGPFAAFPGAGITIWCGMRGWDKLLQRCIFQPYILIMQIVTLVIITFMGGSNSFHPSSVLFAIPAVLGCHVGLMLFERLSNQQFNRLVHGLLIVSGASMMLKIVG